MPTLSDFDYFLPHERIAQFPLSQRSSSQLLCLERTSGEVRHHRFYDLPALLQPGDLLVFNNSAVIPARLYGRKETGGRVELLVERIVNSTRVLAHLKSNHPIPVGKLLQFDLDTQATIVGRLEDLYELHFENVSSVTELLQKKGHVPLPPYIERQDTEGDKNRYQTIYAKTPGSVAAPTAGLHFDHSLFDRLRERGIQFEFVTLHVGGGTFLPVRTDNIALHRMHQEWYEITSATCEKISEIKARGGRIIAVGTTSARCLESRVNTSGQLQSGQGETELFIYPGYSFKIIDGLITNFHLPRSTLLMLVCAFAGRERVLKAYEIAIQKGYRFYSYGDAMLIQ